MAKTFNTIIVLRNDQTTNWEKASSYKLKRGEVGIGYLDNGNIIAKLGVDGETTWQELPQIEGVLENELTLTHNFGRYQTSNGFVKTTDAKGKTISQWLVHALSETKDPVVTQPSVSMTASFEPSYGEAGTNITKVSWAGTFTDGTYEYGSATNNTADSAANTSVTWVIKNGNTELGTSASGSSDYSAQMGDSAVELTLSAVATIDVENAYVPLNNVGTEVENKKITGFDTNGTKIASLSPKASVTGYRKPFWGIKAAGAELDIAGITSTQVRNLGNSGTKVDGFPSSLTVTKGSQQVFFLAKSGTYKTLVAKDTAAMNAGVTFTKKEKAVKVEGANGYTAVDYDMWYVDWGAGIDADKSLALTWTK